MGNDFDTGGVLDMGGRLGVLEHVQHSTHFSQSLFRARQNRADSPSQQRIAGELKVAHATYSRWENGHGLPRTLAALPAIADVLGLELDVLRFAYAAAERTHGRDARHRRAGGITRVRLA